MTTLKPLYALALAGTALAACSAVVMNTHGAAQAPLFKPSPDPYAEGIYANGMIESYQGQGVDIALNPQVSGAVAAVLVREGQSVRQGQPLLRLDDSVQRATTGQLAAQVANAAAIHQSAADTRAKQERSYALDPRSVAKDTLDTARNAEAIAATGLEVARKAHAASEVLLDKYVVRAPRDGVILALTATVGSYASPQGTFDPRSGATQPAITLGTPQNRLQVRAYVDEILVSRLPAPNRMVAQMTPRGTSRHVALRFEHIQPYVSPKIELSDQRQERVDVRVLPVVFSFAPPPGLAIYPGQQVDIYIGAGK